MNRLTHLTIIQPPISRFSHGLPKPKRRHLAHPAAPKLVGRFLGSKDHEDNDLFGSEVPLFFWRTIGVASGMQKLWKITVKLIGTSRITCYITHAVSFDKQSSRRLP